MNLIEQSLQQQLSQHPASLVGLWILDENLATLSQLAPQTGISLLSNRVDLCQRGESQGWQVRLSDFDFTPWSDATLDRIYYRVSKEKAVVHHVINQAWRLLKPGGQLLLLGAKQEGTKTYFDKARKLFGQGQLEKLGKGDFAGLLTRSETEGGGSLLLDDRDYPQLRPIAEGFISKPGLFGWDKLDQGSAFLAEHLGELWPRLSSSHPRVLDLGCGYGYLSAKAHQQGASSIVATDNCAAAVIACQQNFERLGINGNVLIDDCAASQAERFDLLLCNPPFHQGFALEGELTERFVAAASRLTAFDGTAAFVVNQFVPLERKAQGLFAEIDTFADNGSFKLVRLARPRGERPATKRFQRR